MMSRIFTDHAFLWFNDVQVELDPAPWPVLNGDAVVRLTAENNSKGADDFMLIASE